MYNWEKSKSKSNSNSNYKHKPSHHNHSHQYDAKNPTCSSSFFSKFNKSHKPHYPKSHINEDFGKISSTKPPKNRGFSSSFTTTATPTTKDEKISSLRRACLVEKWMEKKVNDKVIPRVIDRSSNSSSTTLLDEFDLQDALFFSTTTTTNTSTSSSSSEIDYSVLNHPKQKLPHSTCFAPKMPKPIKTHSIESKFINQIGGEENGDFMKDRSKAANFYSNLKNLRQPISPGMRLSSFINSLFAKDGKNKKKKCSNNSEKQSKTEENPHSHLHSYSSCSSASSFSRSCMSNKKNINNLKKFDDDGIKRTVRFCPVSVIVDDDSQACGYKSLREEKGENLLMNSNFGRSLSKKYEELRKLNGLEKENGDKLQKEKQQKKLEEVALDLLSGYWDARLSKSHDLGGNNDDDYGVNHGINYDDHLEDEQHDVDDGFSCSSSDLFELDHLSLIEELPVYETTQLKTSTKIM